MNTFLFFDDFLIDYQSGFNKRNFKAQYQSTFYVGSNMCAGHSIIYVEDESIYRLYYSTIDNLENDSDRKIFYAESEDGFNYTHKGSIEEFKHTASVSVFHDNYTSNPDERYKTIIMKHDNSIKARGYVATSRDGVTWNVNTPYKITEHASDSANNIIYNNVLKKYQIFYRGAHLDRRITTILSKDLINWSEPILAMHPTPFDIPNTQYYGMTVYPRDGILLGLLQLYRTDPMDPCDNKMVGKVDLALAYSYNGTAWNRASKDLITDRPLFPEFGAGGQYGSNILETPDKKDWIIGVASPRNDHACGYTPAYPAWEMNDFSNEFGRSAPTFYKIRKYGHTGLESCGYVSKIRFKRLKLIGDKITLNICAPLGYVKFQILDELYNVVEGFSFDDCIPFVGDEVEVSPSFKNKDIKELKKLRRFFIEIECRSATIFALEGDVIPYHASQPMEHFGSPTPYKE